MNATVVEFSNYLLIQIIVLVAVKWLDIHLKVKRMIRSVFESAAVVPRNAEFKI